MQDKLPQVTIAIPFYNAEATLLDAIRSVFAQTYQNWELILVDDGSTDSSLKLANSINDPRVSVYSDGENRHLAARLNQITQLARCEFLMRMDADDLMSPLRLEKQLALLNAQPDIDLVATGVCSLNNDYEPVGVRVVAEGHFVTADILLSRNSGILHASIMGRRAWFKRNPYKETMAKSQDTNLWVRSFSKGDLRIAFISEPLYYYCEDNNITKKKLLLAYAMGRHTIIADAKDGFSMRIKARALSQNLAKTTIVGLFSKFGVLQMLRKRRNVEVMDSLYKSQLINEINTTRNFPLPIANDNREVQGD